MATFRVCRQDVAMSPAWSNLFQHGDLTWFYLYVAIFCKSWRHHIPLSRRGIMSPFGLERVRNHAALGP
jgi:hypothetical protein